MKGRTRTRLKNFFVKPSTLKMMSEGLSTPGYGVFDFLHGYIYGRLPYLYIGIGTGQHPVARAWIKLKELTGRSNRRVESVDGKKTFAEGYHGKVVPLEAARQLVMINEPVRLTNLEKIIPYARAKDIILHNPEHLVVLDCPCRSARQEPCLPLDVCLVVGEPFASFVVDHIPSRSRWITEKEALDILQAEDERGHVHHAFFKDAMLGRFYAICNCCKCCCGAIHAHQNGTPMLASSGYTAHVDEEQCLGCGECSGVCQFDALSLPGYQASIDTTLCMGCGVCVQACPQGALSLERNAGKGEPLEILALLDAAGPKI